MGFNSAFKGLIQLQFSRQILKKKKSSNIKFNENPSTGGAELFHADGRTDRHDKTNSRFPQICERT